MHCIYRITNKVNGKTYIGQHKYKDESNPMKGYKGSGFLLRKAYDKYGFENFIIEVLYSRIRDKATADSMEIWVISRERKSGHSEYNIANGGQGGKLFTGHCHSMNAKQAMSEASKTKWKDDDYRERVMSSRRATYSTEEYKIKASNAHKYHKQNKDWVYKRTRCSLGNTYVKDTKWFNNGIINIRLKNTDEIPEGFIPGRLYFKRRRRK